jgi:hypothetical protein
MSEREGEDMDLREALCICAELASLDPEVDDERVKRICDSHQADMLASLRAHDDRIRAEAIKSAADNLPLSGKGQQYAGAAAWLYRRAALRAAAGTLAHHNQKEGT